jgi:hypothetical protein
MKLNAKELAAHPFAAQPWPDKLYAQSSEDFVGFD